MYSILFTIKLKLWLLSFYVLKVKYGSNCQCRSCWLPKDPRLSLSDASPVTLWWELCRGAAMMEKTQPRGLCFHSRCGNCAQFKEALSRRRSIVLNGSQPKAALLFPLFQPWVYQTWCDKTNEQLQDNLSPTSPFSNCPRILCIFSSFIKGSRALDLQDFVFWMHELGVPLSFCLKYELVCGKGAPCSSCNRVCVGIWAWFVSAWICIVLLFSTGICITFIVCPENQSQQASYPHFQCSCMVTFATPCVTSYVQTLYSTELLPQQVTVEFPMKRRCFELSWSA